MKQMKVRLLQGEMWHVLVDRNKWAMWDLFEIPEPDDFFGEWTAEERKRAIKMVDELEVERESDGDTDK